MDQRCLWHPQLLFLQLGQKGQQQASQMARQRQLERGRLRQHLQYLLYLLQSCCLPFQHQYSCQRCNACRSAQQMSNRFSRAVDLASVARLILGLCAEHCTVSHVPQQQRHDTFCTVNIMSMLQSRLCFLVLITCSMSDRASGEAPAVCLQTACIDTGACQGACLCQPSAGLAFAQATGKGDCNSYRPACPAACRVAAIHCVEQQFRPAAICRRQGDHAQPCRTVS